MALGVHVCVHACDHVYGDAIGVGVVDDADVDHL